MRLFICALWSPAGKGLTSWLASGCLTVSLPLSHWYPGSGVVLDCIDSGSLHPYLLSIGQNSTVSEQCQNTINRPSSNVKIGFRMSKCDIQANFECQNRNLNVKI